MSVSLSADPPDPAALDHGAWAAAAPADRPYVVANMIVSLDGRAALDGRAGGLGDEHDRALLVGLREHVDGVLVGPSTLRDEAYRRLVSAKTRRDRRVAAGLAADPWLVVPTGGSTPPPWQIPLFAAPEQRVAVVSGGPIAVPPGVEAQVEIHVAGAGVGARPRPAELLAVARRDLGVRVLLCEGGPTLLGSLIADDLLDELFVTVSPLLTLDPTAPRLTEGSPPPGGPRRLALATVHAAGDLLFLRYRRP